jgi:hypothetical protein
MQFSPPDPPGQPPQFVWSLDGVTHWPLQSFFPSGQSLPQRPSLQTSP